MEIMHRSYHTFHGAFCGCLSYLGADEMRLWLILSQNKFLFPGLIQVIGLLLPNQTVVSTIIWQVQYGHSWFNHYVLLDIRPSSEQISAWTAAVVTLVLSLTPILSSSVPLPLTLYYFPVSSSRQWLNQSHNACVNYANRNATKVNKLNGRMTFAFLSRSRPRSTFISKMVTMKKLKVALSR